MKKKLIIIVPIIVVITILIVLYSMTDVHYNHNEYCDREGYDCYKYKGSTLEKSFIFDEENINEHSSCKINLFTNKCNINILKWNRKYFIVKKDKDIFIHYGKGVKYNPKNEKYARKKLVGKAFSNKENELYFLDKDHILEGSKNNRQRRVEFNLIEAASGYYIFQTINDHKLIEFIYNSKEDKILDYKKIKTKDAKYLNTDYYQKNGKIKSKYLVTLNGAYKSDKAEMYIANNNCIIIEKYRITKTKLQITDIYDNYIVFNNDYTYNKKDKSINNMKNVDNKELEIINPKYYDKDLNPIKPDNINIDGAYRQMIKYGSSTSISELYIHGNKIKSVYRMSENSSSNQKPQEGELDLYAVTKKELIYADKKNPQIIVYDIETNTIRNDLNKRSDKELFYKISPEKLIYIN